MGRTNYDMTSSSSRQPLLRCSRCETYWTIWLVLLLDNNNILFPDISLYLEYIKIPMDKPDNFNNFWLP